MSFRFLAGALLGCALTIGISSLASTPPPRAAGWAQVEALDARLAAMESELVQMDRRIGVGAEHLGAIDAAIRGEEIWARNVDGALGRIESNQALEQQLCQLRR